VQMVVVLLKKKTVVFRNTHPPEEHSDAPAGQ